MNKDELMKEEIKKGFTAIHTELEKMFVGLNGRIDDLLRRQLALEHDFKQHKIIGEYCPHTGR